MSLSTPSECISPRDIDTLLTLNHAHTLADAIAQAAWRVLNDFQDDVIEHQRHAWPTAAGRAAPAEPYAEINNGRLTLGYRYSDIPVIDLEPIELATLDR